MNAINEERISILEHIFTDQIKNTKEPFNVSGNADEELLQVTIDEQCDSLKVSILEFEVPANKSEFTCYLTKLFPDSRKEFSGKFSDGSLFINDVIIESWSDLECIWNKGYVDKMDIMERRMSIFSKPLDIEKYIADGVISRYKNTKTMFIIHCKKSELPEEINTRAIGLKSIPNKTGSNTLVLELDLNLKSR
ncbi:hypothetical protein [Vibrio cholerae]|uniref:hypothetical protein n=2 Tax=Vibrio cholerae TaxID=666 RepID=UPI0010FCF0DC|nr:hypothetical protein [Vibrio cholerae]TLE26828.1 hypothetical protein D2926_00260 [Vibrio cholerae]TLE33137.1 hypothetical protein D2927_00260 [Vibrio cholerae]TLE36455.1 hypothetical protein D2928_05590 [Vibrio cholerae]TLE51077.1 hypothetical protein D2929_00260 [Vibrio cholerae]TLE62612.1 hypothetical protein D2930_04925 [Vibrio cholerae]